jgi:hypothetical protein
MEYEELSYWILLDAMVSDSSNEYPVYSERNRDNEYFHRHAEMGSRSRRRLTTGRRFSIGNEIHRLI